MGIEPTSEAWEAKANLDKTLKRRLLSFPSEVLKRKITENGILELEGHPEDGLELTKAPLLYSHIRSSAVILQPFVFAQVVNEYGDRWEFAS
jgi:hypothetical protein